MSKAFRSAAIGGMAAALGVASMAVMAPARAADPPPANSFTCRASAVRTEGSSVGLLNVEPFTADEEGGACTTEAAGLLGGQTVTVAGVGSVDVLYARTTGSSTQGRAESGVAAVNLTAVPVTATLLTSTATAGPCPSRSLSGSSTIATATVAGVPVSVPAVADAKPDAVVAGVADVYLNYQTNRAGVLTQRALFVDVNQNTLPAVPDVIVAEAVADVHGNPCAPIQNEGTGRCPPASPEGKDTDVDKDCGYGQPSTVTKRPRG